MSRRAIRRAVLLLGSALGVLAVFAPGAFASGPPIVTAGTPEDLTLTTAMLHGTVNANGAFTKYKVEYGKTKAYGQNTYEFVREGTTPVQFDVEIPGLEGLSTYHYRVSATNSFGTTVTPDATFENPLSWRVEGTPISSLPAVGFEDNFKRFEDGKTEKKSSVEFRGVALGQSVRLFCEQGKSASGVLGGSLELSFWNGCYSQFNGVKTESCRPSEIVLPLDGNFAFTSTVTVKFLHPTECALGTSWTFTKGGYGVWPVAESTEVSPYMYGTTFHNTSLTGTWETAISIKGAGTPGAWKLTGANAGKKFGIS